MCVMPSSSVAQVQKHTLEQPLDANARLSVHKKHMYYSRRKFYKRSYRRHLSITPHTTDSHSVSTPEVAPKGVELLSQQDPVRWGDVDIPRLHKPMDTWLVFPTDPGKFKLPADPPDTDSLLPKERTDKPLFYFFAIVLMGVLGTGMASELKKVRTCHKPAQHGLATGRKRPSWMPSSVWRRRQALRSLT